MTRRGRPPKRVADLRTERIPVNLTKAERATLEARAELAGLPLSTYLRAAALGTEWAGDIRARD